MYKIFSIEIFANIRATCFQKRNKNVLIYIFYLIFYCINNSLITNRNAWVTSFLFKSFAFPPLVPSYYFSFYSLSLILYLSLSAYIFFSFSLVLCFFFFYFSFFLPFSWPLVLSIHFTPPFFSFIYSLLLTFSITFCFIFLIKAILFL